MKSRFLQEARAPEEFKRMVAALESGDVEELGKRLKKFQEVRGAMVELRKQLEQAAKEITSGMAVSADVVVVVGEKLKRRMSPGSPPREWVNDDLRKFGEHIASLKGFLSGIDNMSTALYHSIEEIEK